MRTVALLSAALVLAACKSNAPDGSSPVNETVTPTANAAEVIATVRFLEVEGGCWALDMPQGRIQPVSVPPQYQVDGMRVRVQLRDAPEMMGVCQVGPLREVVSISAE